MKRVIQINYIYWKEGPLLFDWAQSKLPRLLAGSHICKQHPGGKPEIEK